MARRDIRLGAEMDGSTVRLVWLADRRVLRFERLNGVTAEAAAPLLRQMARSGGRRRGRGDGVDRPRAGLGVVAWGSPGVSLRRAHATDGSLRRRAEAVAEVLDSFIPSGASLPGAGAVSPGGPSGSPSVTVGAIAEPDAGRVRSGLPLDAWRMVPAAFTLGYPGLYLAVRDSCGELSLVREGAVVATRQLGCGGLSIGFASTSTEPTGDEASVRRYVAALAREVMRTIEYWKRDGLSCPSQVWVSGRGATLAHLPSVLNGLGLEAGPAPVPDWLDTSAIPESERLAAYGAIAAAMFRPEAQPLCELAALSSARRSRSRAAARGERPSRNFEGIVAGQGDHVFATPGRRRDRGIEIPAGLTTLFLGLLLGAVSGSIVWIASTRSLDHATARLAAATASRTRANGALDYVGKITLAAQETRRLGTYVPAEWDGPVTDLLRSVPAAPPIISMSFALGERSLTVTLIVPNGDGVLADWQAALRTAGELRSSTPVNHQGSDALQFVVLLPSPTPKVTP